MLQRILTTTAVATILATGAVSAQQAGQPLVLAPVVAHAIAAAHHASNVVPTGKPIHHPRHMARTNASVRLRESQPGLIKDAKVPVATALQTALAQQKGTVTSERIERRNGELVYAFNIRSDRKLHHVMVNAMTGAVVPAAKAAPVARAVAHRSTRTVARRSTRRVSNRSTKPVVRQTPSPNPAPVRKAAVNRPQVARTARRSTSVRLHEASPGLIKEAKVPLATALQTALAQQAGTVTSERIERRGGELVYAFNIRSGGKLHHVVVNAMSGAVVAPQASTLKK